jgi:xanthine dehydrogenase accessory factor
MKNILRRLLNELENNRDLALITILATKGSTPQVDGASALFSKGNLIAGTLGGGILEANATHRSAELQGKGTSFIYEYHLNADIKAQSGAICGGSAILLLDTNPGKNKLAFTSMEKSVADGFNGILATLISGKEETKIERSWFENGIPAGKDIQSDLIGLKSEMAESLQKGECIYLEKNTEHSIFLQPVFPLPELIIIGAGHIGKALSHFAKLLDFEVTVIDDRFEYANHQNIPDADHILAEPIGEAVRRIPKTGNTYIVIISRGHRDDSEALKACIDSEAAYIGMIGSKRKVSLMRENFIQQAWSTAEQFDRVHAPVGLDIGSKTVQEIAVSICAELIRERNRAKMLKSPIFSTVILAAGESKRMGKPKMLLPFGDKNIIENVVSNATQSGLDKIFVVLGAGADDISRILKGYPVEIKFNSNYKEGMFSSVQLGLKALPSDTDGVMILLGDQPMVGSDVIDKVLEAGRNSDKGIIIVSYDKKRGHPILLKRKYIQEVIDLPMNKSLKEILIKYPDDVEEVETGSPEILRDIDTESEYLEELKNKNNYD